MPIADMPTTTKKKVPPAPTDGVDYGDGVLIPPMPPYSGGGMHQMPDGSMMADSAMGGGETYRAPGLQTANPGANAAGGPSLGTDIRSDIFKQLYKQGKRSGNLELMNMGQAPETPRPPLELPIPPWEQPKEEPFLLQTPPSAQPPPMEQWPIHLQQGMGQSQPQNPMLSRFPRAAGLMNRPRAGY